MIALSHGRAFLALYREDRDHALDDLDRAMDFARSVPGSPTRPARGLWALMHVLAGTGGDAAIAELRATGATQNHASGNQNY